jgi:hypothetical protein
LGQDREYTYDLPFIPLVTFYADRQGSWSASRRSRPGRPEHRHWQSTLDQTAVLTVARFPILASRGAISDDELTVGPNQWLQLPGPAGRFYYVEHTGKAIAAGRNDLLDLEETMAEYGAVSSRSVPAVPARPPAPWIRLRSLRRSRTWPSASRPPSSRPCCSWPSG